MPEIDRLRKGNDCFELDFGEREATQNWVMKLGIRLHFNGLSPANTVSDFEGLGGDRCCSTVHNWVQKAGLQLTEDKSPDHDAVDETVIQIDDQRYWLNAAVNPDMNEYLHVKLGTLQILGFSEISFGVAREILRLRRRVSRRCHRTSL
jgi:hypothetical protein